MHSVLLVLPVIEEVNNFNEIYVHFSGVTCRKVWPIWTRWADHIQRIWLQKRVTSLSGTLQQGCPYK
jgi:hypothetical protein